MPHYHSKIHKQLKATSQNSFKSSKFYMKKESWRKYSICQKPVPNSWFNSRRMWLLRLNQELIYKILTITYQQFNWLRVWESKSCHQFQWKNLYRMKMRILCKVCSIPMRKRKQETWMGLLTLTSPCSKKR